MEHVNECDALSERFTQKRKDGLVDVKFFVASNQATKESVCRELTRLYAAVDRGESRPLVFKDSTP